MIDDYNWKGNATTILMIVWVLVSPYLAEYLNQDQFLILGLSLVGLAFKLIDAYFPNTLKIFRNSVCSCDANKEECLVLNDEYECGECNDDSQ